MEPGSGGVRETLSHKSRPGTGDIFREVGKAYLHTGNMDKAIEFLNFFLQTRGSDPEGRYWLAVTLQKLGKPEETRVQLNTILEQARSNPRFFRKENRQWIPPRAPPSQRRNPISSYQLSAFS